MTRSYFALRAGMLAGLLVLVAFGAHSDTSQAFDSIFPGADSYDAPPPGSELPKPSSESNPSSFAGTYSITEGDVTKSASQFDQNCADLPPKDFTNGATLSIPTVKPGPTTLTLAGFGEVSSFEGTLAGNTFNAQTEYKGAYIITKIVTTATFSVASNGVATVTATFKRIPMADRATACLVDFTVSGSKQISYTYTLDDEANSTNTPGTSVPTTPGPTVTGLNPDQPAAPFSIKTPDFLTKLNPSARGGLTLDQLRNFLPVVISFILTIGAILFVILIAMAGVQWMSSAGNEEGTTKAKNLLQTALVGFGITIAFWGISNFFIVQILGNSGDDIFTRLRDAAGPANGPTNSGAPGNGGGDGTVQPDGQSGDTTFADSLPTRAVHLSFRNINSPDTPLDQFSFIVNGTVSATDKNGTSKTGNISPKTGSSGADGGATVHLPIGAVVEVWNGEYINPDVDTIYQSLDAFTVGQANATPQEEVVFAHKTGDIIAVNFKIIDLEKQPVAGIKITVTDHLGSTSYGTKTSGNTGIVTFQLPSSTEVIINLESSAGSTYTGTQFTPARNGGTANFKYFQVDTSGNLSDI